MRRRIRAMAEGKFEYKEIDMKVSQERIERMARKNEILKGTVVLESNDERRLKGLIYTTDRRMICEDVQFFGRKVQITYEFHTTGMEEGETNKGEIYIESNAGEIVIPYVVSIYHNSVESDIGNIRDLFQFTNLAQSNYQEAYKIFCSKKFFKLRMEPHQRQLYEALTQSHVCKENMEEFLIGVHKKQPVRFVLNADEENYRCEGDSFKKEILLSKNTWGYCSIQIRTDAKFIYMDKSVITTDDFVGNHYQWEFIVDRKKLHAGRNVAQIIFQSGMQKETMTVEIGLPAVKDRDRMQEKQLIRQLSQSYIKVRSHAMKDSLWLQEATSCVEKLTGIVPEQDTYQLMLAHLYIMSQRETEGKWILNKYDMDAGWKAKQPVLYAYYQYIDALLKKDAQHSYEVCREIQRMTEDNPQDFSLLRIRLFMDEELENNKVWKYKLLKEQYGYGCRSPFLYLEACLLFQKDLVLLNRLDEFECRVLSFAVKHHMLNRELAEKTASLSMGLKEFEPAVYGALAYACEELYDQEHLKNTEKAAYERCVEAICTMLIRSTKRNRKYFHWFEKGVACGMKLTQLYEYYMYTVPMEREEMLPKTLLMYFNFNNSLDYKRKAYLYENVWKYKDRISDLYAGYEPAMKLFVLNQVVHKHVSDHLMELYRNLSGYILEDEEASAAFEEVVFTHKITCENDTIRNVIVKHVELNREEVYPIFDGACYVRLYSPDAVVLLEDHNGRRHLDTIPYKKKACISQEEIAAYSREFAMTKTGLLINRYRKKGAVLSEETGAICEKLQKKPEITKEFRQELIKKLVEFNRHFKRYDQMEEELLKLDYEEMTAEERAHFLEYMIMQGMYDEAYERICIYGPEKINVKRLVRMCSRLIEIDKVVEPLLELCYYVFSKGKYDEMILEYLARYFYGPTWQMNQLWKAVRQFEVETYAISERILVQMLFTGYLLPDSGEVFRDYYKPGCKTDIVQAYLSFFAYYYVIQNQIIDENILVWIEKEYTGGEPVNRDCKAALLKYYAAMPSVPEDKVKMLRGLMREFVDANMVFPFFGEMDVKVSDPFGIREKIIVEHRAAPGTKVYLYYRLSGKENDQEEISFTREEMDGIYDSIYVKELTVFYGEVVQYYIMECDASGEMRITRSGLLENHISQNTESEGRFYLLNEMTAAYQLKDEASLHEMMLDYCIADRCADKLFALMD